MMSKQNVKTPRGQFLPNTLRNIKGSPLLTLEQRAVEYMLELLDNNRSSKRSLLDRQVRGSKMTNANHNCRGDCALKLQDKARVRPTMAMCMQLGKVDWHE